MIPVKLNEAAGRSIHQIDGALTIYTVASERERLLPWLEAPGPHLIDVSGVKDCDCAGLQLLLALDTSSLQAGRELTWLACSEAIRTCACDAGLDATRFQPAAAKRP